jgi:hypothetical protein
MAMQAKLVRAGQDAGQFRDGDPEVLAAMFSGLVQAYQSTDPAVVTPNGVSGSAVTERMTRDELHEILDSTFGT